MQCLGLSRYPPFDSLTEKCQAPANSVPSKNKTSSEECRKIYNRDYLNHVVK